MTMYIGMYPGNNFLLEHHVVHVAMLDRTHTLIHFRGCEGVVSQGAAFIPWQRLFSLFAFYLQHLFEGGDYSRAAFN